jgi:hypothetical protein
MYCDIEGGQGAASVSANSTLTWGPGNIDVDPLFADADGGDLHLKSAAGRWDPAVEAWVNDDVNSPCIDAGTSYLVDDPNYAYAGLVGWQEELWPHGKLTNIGAYGASVQASMSTLLAGNAADSNNDGAVNGTDLFMLAHMWLIEDVLLHEDINRDKIVDFLDLARLGKDWKWQE